MTSLLYVFGPPGSGKSTLLNAVFGEPFWHEFKTPLLHRVYGPCVQFGGGHSVYPGTDRLPFNVQKKAIDFVKKSNYLVFIGEGDRLANQAFFNETSKSCNMELFFLDTPIEICAERLEKREKSVEQSWFKGRVTKCKNLYSQSENIKRLDGTTTSDELIYEIKQTDSYKMFFDFYQIMTSKER